MMRSWWKLRVVTVFLILGVLMPLLCVHFLARPEPTVSESPVQANLFTILPRDIEDITPETAAQYGIRGYLHLTWKDAPAQLAISRSETWNGTLLLQFVSYDANLTELQVNVDPKGYYGVHLSQCYCSEDGSGQEFDISTLLSYSPSGIVAINAGETLPLTVTVQVPADLPAAITSFPLEPTGIAPVSEGIPVISDAGIVGGVTVK
jgi:hypothetical protein